MLETTLITKCVLSYCDIAEEAVDGHWIQDFPCGCYVPYKIEPDEEHRGELDKWLAENRPELLGSEFLIDMDY